MVSFWREEESDEEDTSFLSDGDIHTYSTLINDFFPGNRQQSIDEQTIGNVNGEIRHKPRRIIVDRQLVHVLLPGGLVSVTDDDYSRSSSGTRISRRILHQFHKDPVYTVRLEDTVKFVHPIHLVKQGKMKKEENEEEQAMPHKENTEWYRIAFASLVGFLGGMVGLFAITFTLPTTAVHEEEEVEEDCIRTPSPQRSSVGAYDYDVPQYSFEEHGMTGVRLFHSDDDASSSPSGRQVLQPSPPSSSTSPLLQVNTTTDRQFECIYTNAFVPSMKGSTRRISRTTGSMSSSKRTCSARRLETIDDKTDRISCTSVVKSTTEERIHKEPLGWSLDVCERSNQEVVSSTSGTNYVDIQQQSLQFPCNSELDFDRATDMVTEADCGNETIASIGNIESNLEEKITCRQQKDVAADDAQIGCRVDKVKECFDVADSHDQTELTITTSSMNESDLNRDSNGSEEISCEKQGGEKTDSPTSPPKIVRIVLKETTPHSPCFDPVTLPQKMAAPLTSDDLQKEGAQEQKGRLSPKEFMLESSVSSSVATACIRNRSSNNGAPINCGKRQRQQSSTEARFSCLTRPLYNSHGSRYLPEVVLPHITAHEAEIQNYLCQHDEPSEASFGQGNDNLSPRSFGHTNGQQHIQRIHLSNSLSPASTVAATVHERPVPRRKIQACKSDGDLPPPIPSGEVGQSNSFGLLSTNAMASWSSLDIPDITEGTEDTQLELESPMKNPRSKRKIRKIEKRLLVSTKRPVVYNPSSTLIPLSQRMEEPLSWQFSSEQSY